MKKPKTCEGCPLYEKGHGFVIPLPVSNPTLLLQAEAPGDKEVETGRPLVGDSGKWLRYNILSKAGIDPDRVYMDNTLRCLLRGESGAYPTLTEGKKDAERLCRQYDKWSEYPTVPLMVVGNHAIDQYFPGRNSNVANMHGHIEVQGNRVVGCTYHPAAALYKPNLTPLIQREFFNLMKAAKNPAVLVRPTVKKMFLHERSVDEAVFDLEWDRDTKKLAVVGIAYDGDVGYSTYSVDHGLEVLEGLRNRGVRLVGHNIIKADYRVLGWEPNGNERDTLAEMHLVHPHFATLGLFDLGSAVKYYLPTGDWKREKSDMLEYNGRDCAYNFRLKEELRRDLIITKQTHLVKEQLELAHLSRLMEEKMVKLDRDALYKYAKHKVEGKAEMKSTFPFNPESPKQIREFFKSQGIHLSATDFEYLKKKEGQHELLDRLLLFKEDVKSISTWFPVEVEDDKVVDVGEWLRPEWNPFGTNVDRWSSSDPNMQNLSSGGERELPDGTTKNYANLRQFLIARSVDLELVSYDYGQIENRTVAFAAHDKQMLQDFASGLDFHRLAASRMFSVRYNDVTKPQRYQGKRTVHATNYFETARHLADRLGVSLSEARRLQDLYFSAYPAMVAFKDSITSQFEKGDNSFRNPFGRLRFIFENNSKNKQYGKHHDRLKRASHFLGSSTAARIVSRGAIRVWKELGHVPILYVHDELVYELPKGDEKKRMEIHEILHQPVLELDNMVIPVNIGVGDNYGNLKEIRV